MRTNVLFPDSLDLLSCHINDMIHLNLSPQTPHEHQTSTSPPALTSLVQILANMELGIQQYSLSTLPVYYYYK